MSLFRILFVLIGLLSATAPRAEQALRLSPALGESPLLQSAPPASPSLLPDPSREVQDDLPPIPVIDLTAQPDDLWQRVRNGFSMPNLDSPLVADRQAWYLNRPEYLKRVFERSRRYLYHIVEELEKRGMPTELALLPFVESSFNPLAHSSARALGMWQFIPSTGKSFKLKQNWWYDQRRDIIASTTAALDYLQYIYELHGDWHLALASYNWGEGAVGRAIARNQAKGLPTDYVHLTMPEETRYYVPKLQAIKNIVAEPQLFGFTLDAIENKPYFGVVEREGTMDVALAARLAEIPLDEFIALNPAYSRPVMPDSANSPLVLPADKIPVFLANLENHEAQDKPLSAWHTHSLKRGETLAKVAARYQISEARLRQLNGIKPRARVAPGQALLVPGKDALGQEHIVAQLPKTPEVVKKRTVRKGKAVKGKGGGKKKAAVKGKSRPKARAAAKPKKR